MAVSRLSQGDIHDFLTDLHREGFGTVEPGPSLLANGCKLWLTLLDDGSPGQLRIRKLVMTIQPQRQAREWYSTHPDEDRWTHIDTNDERTSEEVLAAVRGEFLRAIRAGGSWDMLPR